MTRGSWRALVAVLLVSSVLGAGCFGAGTVEGHAWMEFPESRLGTQAMLLHLPPRGGGGADPRGTVLPAFELAKPPVRIASWDDSVYLAYKREGVSGGWRWAVQQVSAARPTIGAAGRPGRWTYPPGRPTALPALTVLGEREGTSSGERRQRAEPTLVGMAAMRDGAAILLGGSGAVDSSGGSASAVPGSPAGGRGNDWSQARLEIYQGQGWSGALLPWQGTSERTPQAPEPGARVLIAGIDDASGLGLALLESGVGGGGRLWVGGVEKMAEGVQGPPALMVWTQWEIELPADFSGTGGAVRWMIGGPWVRIGAGSDGPVLGWTRGGTVHFGVIECLRTGEHQSLRVRPIGGVAIPASASSASVQVAMSPSGPSGGATVAVGWIEAITAEGTATASPARSGPAAEPGLSQGRLVLRELSVQTGRTLYEGPSAMNLSLITRPFQMLAAALFTVVLTFVVYLVKPDRPAVNLPTGTVPAVGVRRVVGGAADLLIGIVLAGLLMRTPLAVLFDVQRYVSGELGLDTLLVVLWLTAMHRSVGESVSGQSAGKLLTGIGAVSVRQNGGAVRPWQAMVRNTIIWTFPPVAMLALLSRDGRHVGDLVAGTAVVEEEEQDTGQ